MIMWIRVDQPFTIPKSVKKEIVKNLNTIRPYFHSNIKYNNSMVFCNLSCESINTDPNLSNLINRIEELLQNSPFDAYYSGRTIDLDFIRSKGLRIPTLISYKRNISYVAKNYPGIEHIYDIIRDTRYKFHDGIPFTMPSKNKNAFSNIERNYYGGNISYSLFESINPDFLSFLSTCGTLYEMHFILRFRDFNTSNSNQFIIELIKHFSYEILYQDQYNIEFNGHFVKQIMPNRILDLHYID